jgi:hypothetical protein
MRKASLRTELERAEARIENGIATTFLCECIHRKYPTLKLSTTLSAGNIAFSKTGELELSNDTEYMLRKRASQMVTRRKNQNLDVCDFEIRFSLDKTATAQLFYERCVIRERETQALILDEKRKMFDAKAKIDELERTSASLREIVTSIHKNVKFKSLLRTQQLVTRLSKRDPRKLFK